MLLNECLYNQISERHLYLWPEQLQQMVFLYAGKMSPDILYADLKCPIDLSYKGKQAFDLYSCHQVNILIYQHHLK